jgi:sarcosine oxidase gamma subunit
MSAALQLEVVAGRERVGCKGPSAEAWLASHGVHVPGGANRYNVNSAGVLAARLATSEFLIEATAGASNPVVEPIRTSLEHADYPSGVYPVLRQDFVLEIAGPAAQDLFLQTCAVDLVPVARESTASEGPVVMTSMIGVSVVLTCRQSSQGPRFTVWSDPSYSTYFHSQLRAIATDIGGGGIQS